MRIKLSQGIITEVLLQLPEQRLQLPVLERLLHKTEPEQLQQLLVLEIMELRKTKVPELKVLLLQEVIVQLIELQVITIQTLVDVQQQLPQLQIHVERMHPGRIM
jgi:hypothetical protein